MTNNTRKFPSKQCRRCGQPALAELSACSECGGAEFGPLKRRRPPPSSEERSFARSISVLILFVQVPTTLYFFVFDISTFASDDPLVRDVDEGMVVLVLSGIASLVGLAWTFRRAVPIWMKLAHVAFAFPLTWSVFTDVLFGVSGIALPGFAF